MQRKWLSGAVGRGLACAVALCVGGFEGIHAQDRSLEGSWEGSLALQGQSLALIITIQTGPGGPSASLDVPSQGAKGIPATAVSLEGGQVRVEFASILGHFSGTASADGTRIAGTWSQGGGELPLGLARRESPLATPDLLRPQEPKPPYPYRTEEVVIQAPKGIRLAGTLVLPAKDGEAKGEGSYPALVFATGSGPQNRDEELLGHKPFLVIADYLARRGIASLRFDDRGIGGSSGDFATATTLDLSDDVEAAFEYLAARPEMRKGAVGILGHSEGGLIAPIVAARNPRVSFVVLLAGPGLTGAKIVLLQGRLIAQAEGRPEAEIQAAMTVNERLYAAASAPGSTEEIKKETARIYLEWVDSNQSMKAEDRQRARENVDGIVTPLSSPWFRTFLSLDPAPYLAKLRIPLLALNGSKDLQVPAKEDLEAIRRALGSGANPKNAYIELPGLNHLFQHAGTGAPSEYVSIEETVAPEALKTIGDWILGL